MLRRLPFDQQLKMPKKGGGNCDSCTSAGYHLVSVDTPTTLADARAMLSELCKTKEKLSGRLKTMDLMGGFVLPVTLKVSLILSATIVGLLSSFYLWRHKDDIVTTLSDRKLQSLILKFVHNNSENGTRINVTALEELNRQVVPPFTATPPYFIFVFVAILVASVVLFTMAMLYAVRTKAEDEVMKEALKSEAVLNIIIRSLEDDLRNRIIRQIKPVLLQRYSQDELLALCTAIDGSDKTPKLFTQKLRLKYPADELIELLTYLLEHERRPDDLLFEYHGSLYRQIGGANVTQLVHAQNAQEETPLRRRNANASNANASNSNGNVSDNEIEIVVEAPATTTADEDEPELATVARIRRV